MSLESHEYIGYEYENKIAGKRDTSEILGRKNRSVSAQYHFYIDNSGIFTMGKQSLSFVPEILS